MTSNSSRRRSMRRSDTVAAISSGLIGAILFASFRASDADASGAAVLVTDDPPMGGDLVAALPVGPVSGHGGPPGGAIGGGSNRRACELTSGSKSAYALLRKTI